MDRYAIIYGTTEGQTAKIANYLGGIASEAQKNVSVLHADGLDDSFNLEDFDRVFLCASVHEGSYQKSVTRFAKEHHEALNKMGALFVSVSLTAVEKDEAANKELRTVVDAFRKSTGFEPSEVHHAEGALKYTQYSWLKRLLMKKISESHNGDTDTSRDFEYTDWDALSAWMKTHV